MGHSKVARWTYYTGNSRLVELTNLYLYKLVSSTNLGGIFKNRHLSNATGRIRDESLINQGGREISELSLFSLFVLLFCIFFFMDNKLECTYKIQISNLGKNI
jgi:hypothetical protein